MMVTHRRKKVDYACVCCCVVAIVFTLIWYHTDSLLSVYTPEPSNHAFAPHTTDTVRMNSDHNKYEKLTYKANDVVRPAFNLGQVIRKNQMSDVEQDEALSQSEILELKKQNLCPNAYRLSESFINEHEPIKNISNLTIAESIAKEYGVNTTFITDLLNKRSRIVILTPVSNSANNLHHYFKILCSLSYPHELISVVIGEDSSADRSYELAHVHSRTLKHYFNRVDVFHFHDTLPPSHFGKHDEFFQLKRRSHLARARNQLLFRGLRDEDYVLWIDCDVKYVSMDLIQHLIADDKDIIAPACMFRKEDGSVEVYDRNSWRETPRSLDFLKRQRSDFLKLEGYTVSMRLLLPDIRNEGHVVPIDGVGGCVLLVKAQCHRKGLIFPPFIFLNHIETEGLAKLAKTMGFSVYGYPNIYVFHW